MHKFVEPFFIIYVLMWFQKYDKKNKLLLSKIKSFVFNSLNSFQNVIHPGQ